MFRDGDRVEVTYKGNPLLGVVKAIRGDKLTMVADGGLGTLTGAASSFRASPVPYEIPVGRPVAKPDRVEVNVKGGGVLTGVVSKVSAGKVTMLVDGSDDRIVSGPVAIFRFVATPMPVNAARAAVVALQKGDRVETAHKGKLLLGVVRSVTGTSLKMVLDGGKSEIGGPPSLFRKSDAPLPSDGPSPMDRWGMTAYKEYARMSEETTAFNGTITLHGKPVIAAENTGKGGCNSYHALRGGDRRHGRRVPGRRRGMGQGGRCREHVGGRRVLGPFCGQREALRGHGRREVRGAEPAVRGVGQGGDRGRGSCGTEGGVGYPVSG